MLIYILHDTIKNRSKITQRILAGTSFVKKCSHNFIHRINKQTRLRFFYGLYDMAGSCACQLARNKIVVQYQPTNLRLSFRPKSRVLAFNRTNFLSEGQLVRSKVSLRPWEAPPVTFRYEFIVSKFKYFFCNGRYCKTMVLT